MCTLIYAAASFALFGCKSTDLVPVVSDELIHRSAYTTSNGLTVAQLDQLAEDYVRKVRSGETSTAGEGPPLGVREAIDRMLHYALVPDRLNRANVLKSVLQRGRLPFCLSDFIEWYYEKTGSEIDLSNTTLGYLDFVPPWAQAWVPMPRRISITPLALPVTNLLSSHYLDLLFHEIHHVYQEETIPEFYWRYLNSFSGELNKNALEEEADYQAVEVLAAYRYYDPCDVGVASLGFSFFADTGKRWMRDINDDPRRWEEANTNPPYIFDFKLFAELAPDLARGKNDDSEDRVQPRAR